VSASATRAIGAFDTPMIVAKTLVPMIRRFG
jgi:hypothetical protein